MSTALFNPPKPKNYIYIALILLALLITSLLNGCKVQERKLKKAKKIAYENPKEFAEFCAAVYPVIPTYILGKDSIIERTLTVKGDSIPCPKVNDVTTYVKCPDAKVIYRDRFRVDTLVKESTAKSESIQLILNDTINDLLKTQDKLNEEKKLSKTRLFYLISLLILFAGSVFLLFKKW